MAHFAKVENGIVQQVIVSEQEFIDTLDDKEKWIQTSYNSRGGVHYLPDSNIPSGKEHLRYNYASVGYTYDIENDAFIPPKPFNSWILNTTSFLWEAPKSMPNNNDNFYWDEESLSWIKIDEIAAIDQ